MRHCLRLLFVVALLCHAADGAAITTLRFDELPEYTPAHGRTVAGVTFTLQGADVPVAELAYNYSTGIPMAHLTDPVLSGPSSGRLFLDFATPTPILEFGIALDVLEPLTAGFTVSLFDALLAPLQIIEWNTEPLELLSEAQFTYAGAAIGRAVIDFSPSASTFALDNLTYATPEPGAAGLLLGGLLAIVVARKRRR